ncbi:MAG TPA: Rieske (2Fe-2S) protein [Verrucomicrobiae bacterium]|nr:Rieske (2Fe-2S) protein [Verrucomicrobiae bacterium]
MNRREFLILAAAAVAGCSTTPPSSVSPALKSRLVNAGTVSKYTADGIYARFRSEGFFIIRQGEKLFALSAICTHKKCKLTAESNRSFYCPCHGSTFDPNGHVTEGPAKRDLPMLEMSIDQNGDLLVRLPVT